MTALNDHLNEYNKYVGVYDTAQQRFAASPDATHLRIRQVPGVPDPRRSNLRTDGTTNIAAVILNGQDPVHDGRDLWVKRKIPRGENGELGLERVSELHSSFLALHYPLLHRNGEDGWRTGIPLEGAAWGPAQYFLWAVGQNAQNEEGNNGDHEAGNDGAAQRERPSGRGAQGRHRERLNRGDCSDDEDDNDAVAKYASNALRSSSMHTLVPIAFGSCPWYRNGSGADVVELIDSYPAAFSICCCACCRACCSRIV
jgi:hypothetical protein